MKVKYGKNIILTACWLVVSLLLYSQEDTIARRIILIGDAGQLTNGVHPVVDAVRAFMPLDKKTTVVYLGDNLYKNGLPDKQLATLYEKARAILDTQIAVVENTDAKAYFIPGNHDWKNGSREGYEAILRQGYYIDFLGNKNIEYFPKDACPGPRVQPLGDNVLLVMFDSQWWLHPYEKPEIESDCPCKTKDELVAQIRDIAIQNADKLIILACHHPFKSNGVHGGFYTWKQHLFPLTDIKRSLYLPMPVIGSIYPIARGVFGTPQDLNHPVYAEMIDRISKAIRSSTSNVIFVSGHDHNLQFIREDGYNYIVSGGGSKQNRTSKNVNSLYNNTDNGFAMLEVTKTNNVYVSFYTVKDSFHLDYRSQVLTIQKSEANALHQKNDITDPYAGYKDYISIAATDKLPPIGGLKKLFMGQGYRKEWSTPIKIKVFRIGSEKGGFSIKSLGGGTQTQSLTLINKITNREWVLRSVTKNPTDDTPEDLEGRVYKDFTPEMNAASHPYGALVIPALAAPLNIQTPRPELFFIPDDPNLGKYQKIFANRIFMLEQKDPSIDNTDTRSSAKVFDKMLEDNDNRPDWHAVLKARLLDMIIGDYDRHLDQWKWGIYDSTRGTAVKGKLYYPIPRDRDKAFFNPDGLNMKLISRQLPFLKGWKNNFSNVDWLNYKAKDFDRVFLTQQDKKEWEKTIDELQQQLPDSVIQKAVHRLPDEIYSLHGENIAKKIINRKNQLKKAGSRYYHFLSKKVNVIGSNQQEYFKVSNYGNGLQVRVYEKGKNNDTSFQMYSRVFDPSVTKEVRLYGLGDADFFEIEKNTTSPIKIRIIGGGGVDTFNINGKVKTMLYDLKISTTDTLNFFIKNKGNAKLRFSNETPLNERSLLEFNYNTLHFPRIEVGYNTDDGLLLGAGISKRTYGFRNLPYATNQNLSFLYAPSSAAFKISYTGEYNHITRKIDLLVNTSFAAPMIRNFFGYGNNTKIDNTKPDKYYQVRYQFLNLEALFRKRFFDNLHLMAGPVYQYYKANFTDNTTNILGKPFINGIDSAEIFTNKNYLGGKLIFLLNNTNNELFPTRGIKWVNQFVTLQGLQGSSKDFTALSSDMTIYGSMKYPARFVFILRAGGGKIYSKNYEFFQAMNFGSNNDMTGFRKNRYAGKSSLYGGLEFRYKLADVNSYILPGSLGLTGFFNTGRVWASQDLSDKWHIAYGGGIYYMPYNRLLISFSSGFSDNEKVLNFSLGTRFNLVY